jgi:hypothetical protein
MEKLLLNKANPKASPPDSYLGERVVMQIGPVTYTRMLKTVEPQCVMLTDATITSSHYAPLVKGIQVYHQAFNRIIHVHLEADTLALEVAA